MPDSQLSTILNIPYVADRIALSSSIQEKKPYDASQVDALHERLLAEDPRLSRDVAQARRLIQTGELPSDISLWDERRRLIWAATFTHLQRNPKIVQNWPEDKRAKRLSKSAAWSNFVTHPYLAREMRRFAVQLFYAGANKSATIDYGKPGSWYWFNPDKNHINVDLLMSLIGGFAESRCVFKHEMAHSQITISPPIRDHAIKEYDELKKKAEEQLEQDPEAPLPPALKKQLDRAALRLFMIHGLYNPFEDNPVNCFAVEKGAELGEKKTGDDLNWTEVVLCGVSHNNDVGQDPIFKAIEADMSSPMQKMKWLKHAVNQVFFVKNGLFPDTPEGWESVGLTDEKFAAFLQGKDRQEFMERVMSSHDMLPHPEDIVRGEAYFKWRAEQEAKKRGELFEVIWRDYGEKLFEDAWDYFQKNPLPPPKSKDPGEDEGEDDDDEMGGGTPTPGSDGKPKPSKKPGTSKPSKTLEDHVADAKADGESDARQDAKDRQKELRDGAHAGPGGWSYDDLPLGDFKDYRAEVARLQPAILRVRAKIKKIVEKQAREIAERSPRDFTLLPEGGDLSRREKARSDDLDRKLREGKTLELDDFTLFAGDRVRLLLLLNRYFAEVDGSGSMLAIPDGATGSDAKTNVLRALMASVIFFEAARPFPTVAAYIGIWGPQNPIFLAKPGDSYELIGQRIQGARDGLQSGTDLAPALDLIVDELVKPLPLDRKDTLIGATHDHIFSDGDIFDMEPAAERLGRMAQQSNGLTTDICVMADDKKTTAMHQAVQKSGAARHIGLVNSYDPEHIISSTIGALLKRVEHSPHFAVDSQQFRRKMRALQQHKPKVG